MAELTEATQQYLAGMQAIYEQMVQLKNTTQALNEVSAVLLSSIQGYNRTTPTIFREARADM